MDWKLIVIDVHDPMAAQMQDIQDVDRLMPGYLGATREWFRLYKVPDGMPENQFGFKGEYQDRDYVLRRTRTCSHG